MNRNKTKEVQKAHLAMNVDLETRIKFNEIYYIEKSKRKINQDDFLRKMISAYEKVYG